MERKTNVQPKLRVKKGDMVKVIAGSSKNKKGRVLQVYPATNRALVEGVNVVKRHTKPSAKNPNGGIIEKEASIHISNLVVIDNQGNATRIGRKENNDGKLQRYSKKSGEFIN